MKNLFSKIILGTAQLGMPYGLGKWNQGLMPEADAFAILDAAWERGIHTLDTSPDYGIAEARIYKYMKKNPSKHFHIISKIKKIQKCNATYNLEEWHKNQQFTELNNCESLSILLHKEADIYEEKIVDQLNLFAKRENLLMWGVSVYETRPALRSTEIDGCSIVQFPFSALDQSFGKSGIIENLSNQKKICLARSVFLQGLLQKSEKCFSGLDNEIVSLISELRNFLVRENISVNEFAIEIASREHGVDNLVLGADTAKQVSSWGTNTATGKILDNSAELLQKLRQLSSSKLKPQLWKSNA